MHEGSSKPTPPRPSMVVAGSLPCTDTDRRPPDPAMGSVDLTIPVTPAVDLEES